MSAVKTSKASASSKSLTSFLKPEAKAKEEAPLAELPAENISICFVGCVSTGKSVLLNSIFCEKFAESKIKRTTMVPSVFIETEGEIVVNTDEINRKISERNSLLIHNSEIGLESKSDYSELRFNVGKLDIKILEDGLVNVYDIPGLNDARTKGVYYEYLREKFTKFNVIIFVIDIHSGLNTSDEMDILKFITAHTRTHKEQTQKNVFTMVVVNKADDMQVEKDADEIEQLVLTGELAEMFEQVKTTVHAEFSRNGIAENLIGIIPLCAIDSYLYRMVKKYGSRFQLTDEQLLKIGTNEMGKKFAKLAKYKQREAVEKILTDDQFVDDMIKLSGFSTLEGTLNTFLTKTKNLRIDNLLYRMHFFPKIFDEMTTMRWDKRRMYAIIDMYNKIFEKIKTSSEEIFDAELDKFTRAIHDGLRWLIEREKNINQIMDYYKDILEIMPPDTMEKKYPPYVISRIFALILFKYERMDFGTTLTLEGFLEDVSRMMTIDMFTKERVEILLETIISCLRLGLYMRIDKSSSAMLQFCGICDEMIALGVKLSKFLRFIIISDAQTCDTRMLFEKRMLYMKHGELIACQYITRRFNVAIQSEDIIWLDMHCVEGISLDTLSSQAFVIDEYYLKYEKTHSPVSFTV